MSETHALNIIARAERALHNFSKDIERAEDRGDKGWAEYYKKKWTVQRGEVRGLKIMYNIFTGRIT